MADLTLSQIRSAKTRMHQTIERAASEAIRDFQKDTGLRVMDVRLSLTMIDQMGSTSYSVVDRVETDVDLQV